MSRGVNWKRLQGRAPTTIQASLAERVEQEKRQLRAAGGGGVGGRHTFWRKG